jgi:hypothetical protein
VKVFEAGASRPSRRQSLPSAQQRSVEWSRASAARSYIPVLQAIPGKPYRLFLQSQYAYESGDSLLRQATQHPGEPFLHSFALVSGRRTIYRTPSRRPRLVDVAQLPETLGLDHAQQTFNLTVDNQRWLQYLEAGGGISHLYMVLGQKVTRHCDRCARNVTALPLFELKCLPELIERIGISPKSGQDARMRLMV